ncbi:unnamed protein product [Closterium sp. NIES-64]|nr:unnamed protein product [Closterium sp. NIES-64]
MKNSPTSPFALVMLSLVPFYLFPILPRCPCVFAAVLPGVHATLLSSQTPPFLPSLVPCSPPFQHHKGKTFYLAPEGGSGGWQGNQKQWWQRWLHHQWPLQWLQLQQWTALKWFFCGDVQGKSAKSMRGGVAQGGGLPTAQHVPLLLLWAKPSFAAEKHPQSWGEAE